jgi:hypothetical protein
MDILSNFMSTRPMPKKNKYDTTCTTRQGSYLDRLAKDGGKAVRIDFSGDDLKMLDELVTREDKGTRAEVVRVLVRNAYKDASKSNEETG